MADGIVTLTSATFDETVAGSDKPVVVDFWAEWCGPCKMIAPILSEIAGEQAEHLTIAKLNVDENPEIAQKFSVMSIPTLIGLRQGQGQQAARRRQGQASADAGARRIPSQRLPLIRAWPTRRGESAHLQRRLTVRPGFLGDLGTESGEFAVGTEQALCAFQRDRGLRIDGRCDDETWASLVESSWKSSVIPDLADHLTTSARRRPSPICRRGWLASGSTRDAWTASSDRRRRGPSPPSSPLPVGWSSTASAARRPPSPSRRVSSRRPDRVPASPCCASVSTCVVCAASATAAWRSATSAD